MKLFFLASLVSTLFLSSISQAVDVILTGGVALKSWEKYRGDDAHDNWWANFIRASTVQLYAINKRDPNAKILWIVFKPSYVTRSTEEGKPLVQWIEEHSKKYKAKLVWITTDDEAYAAINAAPKLGGLIKNFTFFGHSNAFAFMLDYSNDIIGTSSSWMHERDLAGRLNPAAFARDAECWSYGCYTGASMSKKWREAIGVPLWGNTKATRYHPVSEGRLPEGVGRWVR